VILLYGLLVYQSSSPTWLICTTDLNAAFLHAKTENEHLSYTELELLTTHPGRFQFSSKYCFSSMLLNPGVSLTNGERQVSNTVSFVDLTAC